ncbi:MICOS complex subunit Mic60 isoform X2 [Agrilus planipennis]|uniref:MICOS complex subunit MIC60 n=1 Tax=Agrilus planipennis TaxID=224129 RepID=A0A7F5RIZ5_AGRPL|nr:MICOS complex subunit Mic60 isoform X2 [Agrilus planipennis]
MFRIVFIRKLPSSGSIKNKSIAKLCRRYSKQTPPDICPPPPASKSSSGGKYTLGALAVITGATIGYAKYDPEFRYWLKQQAPFTDDILKFIFQEDVSLFDKLKDLLKGGHKRGAEETTKEITYDLNKKPGPEGRLPDTHPKNIEDLEVQLGEAASQAVQWYNRATTAVKNFNREVEVVVEYSIDRLDQKTWDNLKEKSRKKEEAIREAERCAEEALKDLKKLRNILDRPEITAPEDIKRLARKNADRVENDIKKAKEEFEDQIRASSVTEKYWDKVEQARKHFIDELEILFPSIKIHEKKLELSATDLDLFILHAFSNVLFFQKELARAQTVGEKKLQDAITRGGAEELANAQVQHQLEIEKQKLFLDYEKRCLCLRNEAEKELRRQLKLQSEAFADHLDEALKIREAELLREFNRKMDEKLQEEHAKYKKQLAAIVGRLKGMDDALKAQQNQERITRKAQTLWGACQALYRSLKSGCPGLPWHQQLRPLKAEVTAVQKAADPEDELVCAVLNGIPEEATKRGVYSEDALRERFLKVEKMARQLSLVPESGANLPLYLLSFLQSMLLVNAPNPIPQAELDDDPTDFSKLCTNDILQRARYWLDRGDFAQALKYMNLLKGASRGVSREWMNETRIFLETQQAATTLMAHAVASGLAVL